MLISRYNASANNYRECLNFRDINFGGIPCEEEWNQFSGDLDIEKTF